MTIDTKNRIQAVLIMLFFGMFVLLMIAHFLNNPIESEVYQPELPCLIDIQKMLNELEPDNPIKADGVYGPATKEKWERVWMNQQAKKYIEGTENVTSYNRIR